MIRRLCAAAALILAIPASAATDWTRTAAPTAQGGLLVGNPRAGVKMVEIANYTCPRCAHFAGEAGPALKTRVRAGTLAIEIRPFVTDRISLAATIVARCAAPAGFLAVNDALYAQQDDWFWDAKNYADLNAGRLAAYPDQDQVRLVAQRGGIVAVAVAAGLPEARASACLADPARLDDAVRAGAQASRDARATPTILIGRTKLEAPAWTQVSAALRAAGLK